MEGQKKKTISLAQEIQVTVINISLMVPPMLELHSNLAEDQEPSDGNSELKLEEATVPMAARADIGHRRNPPRERCQPLHFKDMNLS